MILRLIAAVTVVIAPLSGYEGSHGSKSDLRAISVAERHHLQQEAAQEEQTDHETPTPQPTPPDVPPPGERNPYIALVAALAIVVVGVTGIFIYRMIKEGL